MRGEEVVSVGEGLEAFQVIILVGEEADEADEDEVDEE
jgi:hypothetical protein